MHRCHARVTRRDELGAGHHVLSLACPEIAIGAQPGQFVHLRVTGTYDPLLRRPISVMLADRQAGTIELLVRAVGRGTDMLANLSAGNVVDVMGPLGNGFPLPQSGQEPLLVAGGVGVAPAGLPRRSTAVGAGRALCAGTYGRGDPGRAGVLAGVCRSL